MRSKHDWEHSVRRPASKLRQHVNDKRSELDQALSCLPPSLSHSEHAAHGAKEITEGDAICAPALEEAAGYRAQ